MATSQETYERILALRAIRSFSEEPVTDDELQPVLEAARWTGSSKNRQNWSWIVLRDFRQQERVAECGDFTDPVRNAPVTIVLVQEPDGYEFDTGRLAQNIMLAADALGLVSVPITLHRDADAARVLGVPEGVRTRYAIALGHPGASAGPSRMGGRKPMTALWKTDRY
jgi:nitroreductase